MFTNNLLLANDGYKDSHPNAMNPAIQYTHSYLEARGGESPSTVAFGFQMYLKDYLCRPITQDNINEADDFNKLYGVPFSRKAFETILNEHGGYMPLHIRAVPEGMVIPIRNVLATVESTDPRFPWLPGFIETSFIRNWYPISVATLSYNIKLDIRAKLDLTCDDPEGQLLYRLHDFGARGATSSESAAIGGAAHLVSFRGSDTKEGIMAARRHYGEPMAGNAIPGTEHSIMCGFGPEREREAFERMMDRYSGPGKMFSVVSDTYDLFNTIQTIVCGSLKQRILTMGGTIVVRPDSGDPLIIPIEVIEMLGKHFGYTVNSKGYKVLPSCIRVIQGDGVNRKSINLIMDKLMAAGWSIENLAFGMGGALHQGVNRDTHQFGFKESAIGLNGVWYGVAKSPKTGPEKRSKKGRLALINEGGYQTIGLETAGNRDILQSVWKNGELLKDWTFAEIRANLDK